MSIPSSKDCLRFSSPNFRRGTLENLLEMAVELAELYEPCKYLGLS
jgi:hypothetical protein